MRYKDNLIMILQYEVYDILYILLPTELHLKNVNYL
jgi:hypothetical protein